MPVKSCGPNWCRERLLPSKKFDPRSFRVKRLSANKMLVIGCPIGKWQPRKKHCSVGTKAQAILRRRKK